MSDLTDNKFYPSIERIWLCIHLNNRWEVDLRSTYRRCRFWQQKSYFQMKCITENLHAYIEKPTHPKRITVWCEFWSRGMIGPFFFENEQGRPLHLMAIVIGASWTNFCSQKLKRRILATFGFNRTALRPTRRMFCVLFLKITLSTAELMSFDHLGAAIWLRWTNICVVPAKISVTPTSQRQLTLQRTIFVKPLVKYHCTQSLMYLKIGTIM